MDHLRFVSARLAGNGGAGGNGGPGGSGGEGGAGGDANGGVNGSGGAGDTGGDAGAPQISNLVLDDRDDSHLQGSLFVVPR